ncbi:MAG TPA: RDD family protein [Acidimicrobiales bacterium]|nr:RDD family protein [Acidimicrobiales bacterium]
MDFEERYATITPEGLRIDLELAGIGSRAVALFIDTLVIDASLLVIVLVAGLVGASIHSGIGVFLAVLIVAAFLVNFGYFVAFELLSDGRSLGKRALGLRVVNLSGGAIGLRSSLIRNLMRLAEGPILAYLPAIIAVLISKKNQRLGDLAAGTIVIRQPRNAQPVWQQSATVQSAGGLYGAAVRGASYGPPTYGWDVSAVTTEELAVVRQFLWRANELPWEARQRIAADIAGRLMPKVVGYPPQADPEWLLYQLSLEKLYRP